MIIDESGVLPIVVFENGGEWPEVLKVAAPHLDKRGLAKLEKAFCGAVKTVLVERHYIDKDYRDTFSNYHSKRFQTPNSRCNRLHFFNEVLDKAALADVERMQRSYLGYSVIRPTRPNCVGRTLICPVDSRVGEAHIRTCTEEIHLLGVSLKVHGFPFISQDADVTVCAQSALWTVLRYFSNQYSRYGEIHPFQIGQLTKDYSIGRMYPSDGLTMWQMAEALRQHSFEPLIYSRDQHKDQFEHLLYTYIESGIPCLVGVPQHVISAFGHFSNIDSLLIADDKRLHYSSEFNQGFVISDDNTFPYQPLRQGGALSANDSRFEFSQIDSFIAPLPDKVYLSPEGFRKAAELSLAKFISESPTLQNETLMLRIFLTTGTSFKGRILERGMGHSSVAEVYRYLPMPHFIWVCELSTPGLFEQRKVLGEIIWDATRNGYETSGLVACHLPEKLIFDLGSSLNGPEKLIKSNLQNFTSYALYVSNLRQIN
ncbi:hypothetical protein QEH59_13255 [Coraliomargarita sp. SDUM461004]|uniref:YcaO domain-containing protein n=1 Tax=Thalassobacterium sedimentorum TaxID=3041258 RepID=A0ABU1AL13_9BACT|nr:hypothetical protein [Coraliomargarita sp. SDUM461004]MDQ8195397.1 hypothetical protein [Coraliomargarita sp. SDUM461004]